MYENIAEIPRFCPYCRKDLSVYNHAGARKHILRCASQKIPTYTYRASVDGL